MPISDTYVAALRIFGWSVDQTQVEDPSGQPVWQITCTRNGQAISTRGRSQLEAWAGAVRRAQQIEHEQS